MEEAGKTRLDFITGGGEMGERIRNLDWNKTPLGSADSWPQSLRTTLGIILNSKFPMFLFWGEDLTCFYNDAYRPSLGIEGKHPSILGMKGQEAWREIWHIIKPLIDQVLAGGEGTWSEDQLIPIYRNGKIEDVYWTFSYSPATDETGKPKGTFVACTETTEKVNIHSKLEESEKKLQRIMRQAPVSMCILRGTNYVVEVANERQLQLWGKTAEEALHKPLFEALPEGRDQGYEALLKRAITGETIVLNEVPTALIRFGTKETILITFTLQPLFADDGKVSGVFSVGYDVTEQVTARKKIEESETKYRNLFESIDDAFCIIELIYDDDGKPVDFRWLEVNPAFSEQTGLIDVAGKLASQVIPHTETSWFEMWDKVLKTGEAVSWENWHEYTGRWYHSSISRIGGAYNRRLAIVASDTTERKNAEKKQAFLLKLNDHLRFIKDPGEIQQAAMNLLGEELKVMRATYIEVDDNQDTFEFTARYEKDAPPFPRYGQLSHFSVAHAEGYRSGRTLVLCETYNEPQSEAFLSVGVRAAVGVPLVKNGKLTAIVGVNSNLPRSWTSVEVEILEELAERTWAAVERAKAEEALRQSKQQIEVARDYAEATLRTSPVPLLVLNSDLTVLTANEAFYETFQVSHDQTEGRYVSDLGNGQWNIPRLRELLEDILPNQSVFKGFEITHDFETIGARTVLLNARQMLNEASVPNRIILVVEDITERKQQEQNQAFLLKFSDALRAESSADVVANKAIQMLFEHLGLDRCYIAVYRLSDDEADFTHQIGNDRVRTLPKGIRLSDFPNALQIAVDTTLIIDDVANTEGLSEVDKANMHELGMYALVAAGLRKGDHNPIWTIVAVSASPRHWTKAEIQLMEEATERVWVAIEKSKAEEALRISEQRLQKVLSIETVGVTYFDPQGGIHDCNAAFERMSGFSKNDLSSGSVRWRELTPPEFMEATLKSREELMTAGQNTPYEKQYIKPDGTLWWGMCAAKRLSDVECVEFVVDITESKKTTDALRESEQRLHSLIENLPGSAVFIVDKNLTYLLAQGEALAEAGFNQAEFTAKHCTRFSRLKRLKNTCRTTKKRLPEMVSCTNTAHMGTITLPAAYR